MRQDVVRMPSADYYGNLTTGYHSVDLTRVDSPQQIRLRVAKCRRQRRAAESGRTPD